DRVEARGIGQGAQMRDLLLLPGRVGGRQAVGVLEDADALGVGEALGEQMDECGVDVVDAATLLGQQLAGSRGVVAVVLRAPGRHQADRSCRAGSTSRSLSLPVTISGARPSVITPSVMTTLTTSPREGTSNMTCCSESSRIARRPRAPVPRSI